MGLRGGAPGQQDAMSAVRQLLQGQPQAQAQAQSQFTGLQGNQPGAQQQAGNIFGGLAGYTPGVQGTASNALNSLIQGGGLSPEFIEASRRQILQPSKEQLLGNINQMSGGASLSSPVYQELLRKQEQDFNDSMIRAGQQNLGGYLGQGYSRRSTVRSATRDWASACRTRRTAIWTAGRDWSGIGWIGRAAIRAAARRCRNTWRPRYPGVRAAARVGSGIIRHGTAGNRKRSPGIRCGSGSFGAVCSDG